MSYSSVIGQYRALLYISSVGEAKSSHKMRRSPLKQSFHISPSLVLHGFRMPSKNSGFPIFLSQTEAREKIYIDHVSCMKTKRPMAWIPSPPSPRYSPRTPCRNPTYTTSSPLVAGKQRSYRDIKLAIFHQVQAHRVRRSTASNGSLPSGSSRIPCNA